MTLSRRVLLGTVAAATVLPASRADQVPVRPAAPTMAVSTMSTSGSETMRTTPLSPWSNSHPAGRSAGSHGASSADPVRVTQRGRWTMA